MIIGMTHNILIQYQVINDMQNAYLDKKKITLHAIRCELCMREHYGRVIILLELSL